MSKIEPQTWKKCHFLAVSQRDGKTLYRRRRTEKNVFAVSKITDIFERKLQKWNCCHLLVPWHLLNFKEALPHSVPKCPWHKNSWILSRALLTFHGQIIKNFQNFHGYFFRNFHVQVRKSTGISKNSWHGHFYVVTGTFVLWSQFFLFTALTTKVIFVVSLVASRLFSLRKKHVPCVSS